MKEITQEPVTSIMGSNEILTAKWQLDDDKKNEDLKPTDADYQDEPVFPNRPSSFMPLKGGRSSLNLSSFDQEDLNEDLAFLSKRRTFVET